ncbi:MAG: DeoR/GlpR family DNA-binding transcription regulator [Synergistaceae bacterium]|jgi:DeoR/GlpR family transcriptional regulator of sugar metabolism|nr:DeoR/GlpR family DNA-binding transcription regulator [Synergistaceae bacterium]
MFPYDRRSKIKKMLLKQKQVGLVSLSRQLGVSEITVRRDFDYLEKEGFLTKIYGGAMLNEEESAEANANFDEEDGELGEARAQIAKIAAHFVRDGNSVILGQGGASVYIARRFGGKQALTVVTNDINVSNELSPVREAGGKVILTGGEVGYDKNILSGPLAVKALEGMHVDISFIEIDGVDLESGYSVESYEKAEISNQIFRASDVSVAMFDSDKFFKSSFCRLAPLSQFAKIVTSGKVPDEFQRYCVSGNIKLYQAFDVLDESD